MSRSTQAKFLEALEVIAATYKVEVINDRRYANTGTVRMERTTEFKPLVKFYYSFQDGYASFDEIYPPFGLKHLQGKSQPYVKPHELQARMLDPIADVLKKASHD